MRTKRYAALLAVCTVALSAACDITKTGDQGNLEFQYVADSRLIPPSFNRPVATGLRVQVRVQNADTDEPVDVLSAGGDTSILQVPARSGAIITLEGISAGTTSMSVRASGGLTDSVSVDVADIDEITLKNPGPLLEPATGIASVIAGADVRFPVTLKDAQGRVLIGYGTLTIPIEPTTAGAQVSAEDPVHTVLRFTETGDVTLRPLNGTPLQVKVISPDAVATMTLGPPVGTTVPDIPLDGVGWAALRGTTTDGTSVVGLGSVAAVTSESIAVCRVEAEPVLGDGVYRVSPLAVGDCTIKAVLNAQAAQMTFKVVEAAPSSESQ